MVRPHRRLVAQRRPCPPRARYTDLDGNGPRRRWHPPHCTSQGSTASPSTGPRPPQQPYSALPRERPATLTRARTRAPAASQTLLPARPATRALWADVRSASRRDDQRWPDRRGFTPWHQDRRSARHRPLGSATAGENDAIDAEHAASAELGGHATAVPDTNDSAVEIKVAKDVVVKARTAAMVSLKCSNHVQMETRRADPQEASTRSSIARDHRWTLSRCTENAELT